MGLKFNRDEKETATGNSLQLSFLLFIDNVIVWVKANWKLLLIGISVALCAILCLMVAGKIMKEYFE